MRRCVLCGRWVLLAFLRAREKKALVVVVAQLAKIERPVNRTPACLPPIDGSSARGALSRWLLWGESRSLARNTAAFRRRFRLQ